MDYQSNHVFFFLLWSRHIVKSVCSYHVTYLFQSESTLYNSWQNVKELLAWNRHEICDCNGTRTHNHLVHNWTRCGFESHYSHLNFIFRTCFEQGVPWYSGNYRVLIHSETCTSHDKNIELNALYRWVLPTQLKHLANLTKWLSVCLWTKWLWVWVPLQSLKLQILCLFWARSFLTLRQL